MITLDASQSDDPDGSVAEYRWDFDADGIVDWSTSDPAPPAASSGGEVDTITPGDPPGPGLPPATVTATYHQGHAEYIYPRVSVVDDKGGRNTRSAKLGVSGWVREVISSEMDEFNPPGEEIMVYMTDASLDPSTGELCFVGASGGGTSDWGSPWAKGLYFLRRHADGTWDKETACPGDAPLLRTDAAFNGQMLVWQSNGQPTALFSESNLAQNNFRLLLASRQPDGAWSQSIVLDNPVSFGVGTTGLVQTAPGEYYLGFYDYTGETDPRGLPAVHYYVGRCHDSEVETWDTGWDTVDEAFYLGPMSLDPVGQPMFALPYYGETNHELWIRQRLADGTWVNERLDSGLPILDNDYTTAWSIAERADGVLGISVERFWHHSGTDWRRQWCCAFGKPGALALIPLRNYGYDDQTTIRCTPLGFSIFTTDDDKYMVEEGLHHDLVDSQGKVTSELLYQVDGEMQGSGVILVCEVFDAAGHCLAVIGVNGGEFVEDGGLGIDVPREAQLLCTRVDPRIP